MKVSIITVSFNSEQTIVDTLRSVNAQTYSDIEHIVIDGGSRDRTVELVKSLGTRVHHLSSEPDRGIYDAMNKGLAKATGDVVAFLNSDDYYADDTVIARVISAYESMKVDAVLGDAEFFRPERPGKVIRRYRSDRFTPARLAWGWMPAHPAMFLKKCIYNRVGSFKTDFRIAGDFEMIARIFKDGRVSYGHLPEVLVRMRIGGVSTSGLRNTAILNLEVLRACRENGIRTSLLRILTKYPIKLWEFTRH